MNAETATILLCRLCTQKIKESPIPILNQSTCKTADIIQQHYGISVIGADGANSGDDGAPYLDEYLCQPCWTITDQFHQLYTAVRQHEVELLAACQHHSHTDDKSALANAAAAATTAASLRSDLSPSTADIKTEDALIECKVEFPDADDANVADHLHDHQRHQVTSSPTLSSDSSSSFSGEDERRRAPAKTSKSAQRKKLPAKRCTTATKSKAAARKAQAPDKPMPAIPRKTWRKHTPDEIAAQDIRIREYFAMKCELCDVDFAVLRDAVNHYPLEHEQPGYLRCCGKKFFKRTMLLDHIQHHGDPNAFHCALCKKSYISQAALELHMYGHDPAVPKPFHCVVCNVDFVKNFQLLKHQRTKHVVSTNKSFECDICNKFFYTKWQVSTHIQSVHNSSHICDSCAATFKTKAQLDLHQRRVHIGERRTKVQCSVCGDWLLDKYNLRKHMTRKHQMTTVACQLCGKVAPNQYALDAHMGFVHSARLFPCTMCDKSFKRAIGLREHMASHTGVDLYTCSFCPRTFKSNSNMFVHRKKAHPVEWSRDRERRNQEFPDL